MIAYLHILPKSGKVDKGKGQSKTIEPFLKSIPLNMQRSFLKTCVLLAENVFSLRSIIQYFLQNTRFLHNMQCVINIQYCCEKV